MTGQCPNGVHLLQFFIKAYTLEIHNSKISVSDIDLADIRIYWVKF